MIEAGFLRVLKRLLFSCATYHLLPWSWIERIFTLIPKLKGL